MAQRRHAPHQKQPASFTPHRQGLQQVNMHNTRYFKTHAHTPYCSIQQYMHVAQCIAAADEQHQQQYTQYKLIPTWYASSHCALTCLAFCLGCCGDTRAHTLCTAHTKCTLDSALHQTCAWWPGKSLVVESQPACQGLQRRGVGVGSVTLQQSQYASCTGQVLAGATWAIALFHSFSQRSA